MSKININRNLNQKKISNNIVLNSSIIVLVIINILLVHSLIKNSSIFSGSSDELTADKVKPRIQVEVLNGCGISGTADKITDFLRTKGFDVVNLGNYRSFEIEKSIVISRNGKKKNAEMFASAIGLVNMSIIYQTNPDYLLDVTFVLGKDYNELIPLNKRLH